MNFWLVCLMRGGSVTPLGAFASREEAVPFAREEAARWSESSGSPDEAFATDAECRLVEFRGGLPVGTDELAVILARYPS